MNATAAAALNPDSFAAMFEESLTRKEMRAGELITAQVVRVDHNVVVVNAGLKSESLIPVEEFLDAKGELEVKAGDFVTVAIESLENGYGETKLSREKAKRLAAWHDLEVAMEEGKIVEGVVSGKVKGGLTAMVNGIRAFLPGSLVDIRPVKDTTPYENKTMELKVIKLDRKRNNVVVSRRAVLEASMGADREAVMENLKEGAIVKGVVKNITDYGAFVDLGGIDGLLHRGIHVLHAKRNAIEAGFAQGHQMIARQFARVDLATDLGVVRQGVIPAHHVHQATNIAGIQVGGRAAAPVQLANHAGGIHLLRRARHLLLQINQIGLGLAVVARRHHVAAAEMAERVAERNVGIQRQSAVDGRVGQRSGPVCLAEVGAKIGRSRVGGVTRAGYAVFLEQFQSGRSHEDSSHQITMSSIIAQMPNPDLPGGGACRVLR